MANVLKLQELQVSTDQREYGPPVIISTATLTGTW